MAYNRKDSYYHKAKQEGYHSRAAYKLLELSKKYNLIKSGNKILDCGAAPGGWSQVALKLVGRHGKVVAVDYANIDTINDPNFTFIKGDMKAQTTIDAVYAAADGLFDVVMSDMAPKTTGVKLKDHVDSIELATLAADLASKLLKPGGSFIVKLFDGEDREQYISMLKKNYKNIRSIRPDATRKASYEMYIIATSFIKPE